MNELYDERTSSMGSALHTFSGFETGDVRQERPENAYPLDGNEEYGEQFNAETLTQGTYEGLTPGSSGDTWEETLK